MVALGWEGGAKGGKHWPAMDRARGGADAAFLADLSTVADPTRI